MSYQGVLTGTSGTPVPDGTVSLTFRLYDSSENSDTLWQETQSVQVTNGVFNVILGSNIPLNLPFDKQYWLGITISGGTELTPRVTLTASPYSLNSHSTIAETESGQGLTIRDSNGNPTHQLDANGDVKHNGVGTFLGGIIVGDSIVVVDTGNVKTTNSNFLKSGKIDVIDDNIPKVAINVYAKNIGLAGEGADIGVYGKSPGKGLFGFSKSGDGVYGKSSDGIGVNGHSGSATGVSGYSKSYIGVYGISDGLVGVYGISPQIGVEGQSDEGTGVHGLSVDSRGVFGESENGIGVKGVSTAGDGVIGQSTDGAGVFGISSTGAGIVGSGAFGGWFQNKVKIDEVPIAPDQERFLVWDNDNIIKYRNLPSGGSSFDGILQDKALVVKSGQTEVFRVNTDGTSYHKGIETFDDDVIFKGTNGKGAKLVDGNGNTIGGFGRKDLNTGQRFGVYGKAQNPGDLAGVFDGDVEVNGEIVTGSLHIVNGDKDTLISFNADGTSFHKGKETYLGGIDLPDDNTSNSTSNVKAGKFNGSGQLLENVKVSSIGALDGKNINSTAAANEPTIWGYTERTDGAAVLGQSNNTSNTYPANWGVNFGGGAGVVGEVRNTSSNYPAIWALQYGIGSALLIDHQGSAGNIFTGRSGGVNQVRIDKTGKGFFNGGTQTGGADVAEAFNVEGMVQEYEPGDVLVISTRDDRTVTKSSNPYSTLVVGVYATKPGVLLTEHNVDDPLKDNIPMGVIGVIPTKVCSENGSIHRGDLLVTSSVPGYAMKGTDREKLTGAVIGKALENFDGNGTGKIKVLVNTK